MLRHRLGSSRPSAVAVRLLLGLCIEATSLFLDGVGAGGIVASPRREDSTAEAVSEARLMEAALNSLTGLVAEFKQTVESPGLPGPQVEEGTVYFLRPGRMRWEYRRPPGKLAIADGRKTYLYLPEDRQLLIAPLDEPGTNQGMSILLRDRVDLVDGFAVSWTREGTRDRSRSLMLTPRSPRPEYQHLLIEPGPDHLIRSFTSIDSLGSRISYRFTRVRRVEELDETLFRFTPPEGVEVQELAPR
jgi:outer membrane lipoprotein carrier protein